MANKIELTRDGEEKLQKEYRHLIDIDRPEVIEQLKAARAQGDLSENADYDAARNRQAEVEARIKEIEYLIDNATLISNTKSSTIKVGSTVEIEYVEDKETETYQIVGSTEADPFENKISNESPIAVAIIGKKVGDVVSIESPNGSYDIRIVSIK